VDQAGASANETTSGSAFGARRPIGDVFVAFTASTLLPQSSSVRKTHHLRPRRDERAFVGRRIPFPLTVVGRGGAARARSGRFTQRAVGTVLALAGEKRK
jgi:hypothetical protein